MSLPKSVKLVYFNGRGRAEICRWVLAQAGVDYEDVRIEFADWPQLKPTTPTGMLPYAEIDGKKLGASPAISIYLAKQYNMMGGSEWDEAEILSVLDVIGDTLNARLKYHYCKDEKMKEEYSKDYGEKSLPTLLNLIDKRLEGGKEWLVGNKLSLADITLAVFLSTQSAPFDAAIQERPQAVAIMKRVMDLPNISKWIAKRPQTEF